MSWRNSLLPLLRKIAQADFISDDGLDLPVCEGLKRLVKSLVIPELKPVPDQDFLGQRASHDPAGKVSQVAQLFRALPIQAREACALNAGGHGCRKSGNQQDAYQHPNKRDEPPGK